MNSLAFECTTGLARKQISGIQNVNLKGAKSSGYVPGVTVFWDE